MGSRSELGPAWWSNRSAMSSGECSPSSARRINSGSALTSVTLAHARSLSARRGQARDARGTRCAPRARCALRASFPRHRPACAGWRRDPPRRGLPPPRSIAPARWRQRTSCRATMPRAVLEVRVGPSKTMSIGAARRRRLQDRSSPLSRHLPDQEALVAFLAVVEASRSSPHRRWPVVRPAVLRCQDWCRWIWPSMKGLRMRREQGAGGELMVEAGHRHAMFAEATEHRAVRHADRRQPRRESARDRLTPAIPQQFGQLLADGLRRLGRARAPRRSRGLVDRGQAGEERSTPSAGSGESPPRRFDPV
jgi:hypothetical protein